MEQMNMPVNCNRSLYENGNNDTWRIFVIMAELVEAFDTMKDKGPLVSIFGSARTPEGAHSYESARELAGLLVKSNYGIISGGGPDETTEVILFKIYNEAFQNGDRGMASAISVIVFIILMVLTILNMKFGEEKEEKL